MLNQYLSGHLIVTHHKMYMNLGCSTRGYDCLQLQMILVHTPCTHEQLWLLCCFLPSAQLTQAQQQ